MNKIIHHAQEYSQKKKAAIERKTKVCIGCKQEKSKDQFTNDKQHMDLKYPYCFDCASRRQRELYNKQPKVFYQNCKRSESKNPQKRRAWSAVRNAIKKGNIIKPDKCSNCGGTAKRVEAHHYKGYNKENYLDVVWLCTPCHRKADTK